MRTPRQTASCSDKSARCRLCDHAARKHPRTELRERLMHLSQACSLPPLLRDVFRASHSLLAHLGDDGCGVVRVAPSECVCVSRSSPSFVGDDAEVRRAPPMRRTLRLSGLKGHRRGLAFRRSGLGLRCWFGGGMPQIRTTPRPSRGRTSAVPEIT